MIKLRDLATWQKLLQQSHEEPVIILKHSNTCPISATAYQKLQQAEMSGEISLPIYVVIVQISPEVSQKIAEDLKVTHESPQLLIIKEERLIYQASHDFIDPTIVSNLLLQE